MIEKSQCGPDILDLACRYCGCDPWVATSVQETVLDLWDKDEKWTLEEFKEILATAINEIPIDQRDTAMITFTPGDYDEPRSGYFTIKYTRPETHIEIALRVEGAVQYARRTLASERASYERLKQKFG